MPVIVRPSSSRGHNNHGWLNAFFTFSFADYYNPKFNGFGPLRVINEDFIQAGEGFPLHPHANYEIFTYIVSGAIQHTDSMGNSEVCRRGDVQFTSAGSGIYHSEFSDAKHGDAHALQIWVKPSVMNLHPSYSTVRIDDEKKRGKFVPIISPDARDGTIRINQNLLFSAAILSEGSLTSYKFERGTKGYLHVVMADADPQSSLQPQVQINGEKISAGDGVFFENENTITITVLKGEAEILLFDM